MEKHNNGQANTNENAKSQILPKQCMKRMVIIALIFTIVSISFLYRLPLVTLDRMPSKKIVKYIFQQKNITCYKTPEKVLRMADANFKPSNKNIYFVESSCKGGLNSRQACSVETAARSNPNRSVIVLVTGPLSEQFMGGTVFIRMVTELNIEFIRVNVTEYSKGTPLEEMFQKEVFNKSWWPVVHTSDALRILTIYKYGGIYLDLDVLVVKSFDTLPDNFIVNHNNYLIAASDDGIGKNFTTTAVIDLKKSYKPHVWSYNGPKLLMRALGKICDKGKEKSNETCHGFHVLDTSFFYAVPYQSWQVYMQDWRPKDTSRLYTHHIWNAMGYKAQVPKNSYYAKLAKQYCPIVYDVYKDRFGE